MSVYIGLIDLLKENKVNKENKLDIKDLAIPSYLFVGLNKKSDKFKLLEKEDDLLVDDKIYDNLLERILIGEEKNKYEKNKRVDKKKTKKKRVK